MPKAPGFVCTLLFLCAALVSKAQIVVDSFPKAVASSKLFVTSNISQGIMANGHPYCLSWNVAYPGANMPIQFVRVDLATKKITTKRVDSAQYYTGQVWGICYDSTGTLYLTGVYGKGSGHLYKLNLADPDKIGLADLGAPFDGHIIYSISLGRDCKIYIGSSGDSKVGYYDPATGTIKTYPAIDPRQNFILSIAGDSSWIYSQVGQTDSIFVYATRKSDGAHFKLSSNPATTRYGVGAMRGFCSMKQNYASYGHAPGNYYLLNGTMQTAPPAWAATRADGVFLQYQPVPTTPAAGYYYNTPAFDAVTNRLFYTHGFGLAPAVVDSVLVPTDSLPLGAGGPMFMLDDTTIYYKGGIQYGGIYAYNMVTGVNKYLGSPASNIYSAMVDKDGKGVYMGGYPSGSLLFYDPAREWTADKIIHGTKVQLGSNSNPRLVTYFRTGSNPAAGFHHTFSINYDYSDSLIVCSGDIIRIQNSIGIGVYNTRNDSAYGHNYEGRNGLAYEGVPVRYKKWMLLPSGTKDSNIIKACIWFYDAQKNEFVDSITLPGFTHYGNIFVMGDTLFGFNKTTGYKVNLRTKGLIAIFNYPPQNADPHVFVLHDGQLLTNIAVPASFYPRMVSLPDYNVMYERHGVLYGTNKKGQIVRIRGVEGEYGKG